MENYGLPIAFVEDIPELTPEVTCRGKLVLPREARLRAANDCFGSSAASRC